MRVVYIGYASESELRRRDVYRCVFFFFCGVQRSSAEMMKQLTSPRATSRALICVLGR